MLQIDERTLRKLYQIATWARDCTPDTLADAFGDVSLVLEDAERVLSSAEPASPAQAALRADPIPEPLLGTLRVGTRFRTGRDDPAIFQVVEHLPDGTVRVLALVGDNMHPTGEISRFGGHNNAVIVVTE